MVTHYERVTKRGINLQILNMSTPVAEEQPHTCTRSLLCHLLDPDNGRLRFPPPHASVTYKLPQVLREVGCRLPTTQSRERCEQVEARGGACGGAHISHEDVDLRAYVQAEVKRRARARVARVRLRV